MNEYLSFFATNVPWSMILRLLSACVAGAVLGWERERSEKPAGLRTHMMVSLGAATFVVVAFGFAAQNPDVPSLRLDPTRVIAGIIGGVGFLGAGTIIEARGHVRGITTAAGIWVTAAVGTACGLGMYGVACTSVALAVLILTIIGRLAHWYFPTNPSPASSDKERNDTNPGDTSQKGNDNS